jgi:hypothetical protein
LGEYNGISAQLQEQPEVDLIQSIKYIHWREDGSWLGYIEEFADCWTQGDTLDDLVEHLNDFCLDLSGGYITGARKVGELVMP